MSVQDLTNTKWVINEYPSQHSDGSYFINFISHNTNETGFYFNNQEGFGIGYSSGLAYYTGYWTDESYRLIEITGGTDVTNATLIAWLEANAVQVPVVDLTDTEWVIDSTTCSAGYGQFMIDHTLIQSGDEFTDQVQIWVGYTFSPMQGSGIPTANTVTSMSVIGVWAIGDSISITGGDVANPNLISWLATNATYQAPSGVTVDMSSLSGWSNVSAGSHTLTIKAKATGYRDSNPSAGVSFTKAARYTVVVTLGGSMLMGSGRTFAIVNGTDTYVSDGESATYTLSGVQTIQFFAQGGTRCSINSTTLGLSISGTTSCQSSVITLTQDVNDVTIGGNF